jgi:hypothetical protein
LAPSYDFFGIGFSAKFESKVTESIDLTMHSDEDDDDSSMGSPTI